MKKRYKKKKESTTINDLEKILQSCKIGIQDGDPYADFVDLNLINNNSTMLPSLLVNWKDQDLRERLTLFVWVLSGLEPQDLHAKILTGGEKLRIHFPWPEKIQDAMQLTKYRYCRDASKVVEIETIVKNLKGGSASSPIFSTVDFHLGMKVEEQFYSETIVTAAGRDGRRKNERGNTVLKFLRRRAGRNEEIPILVQKFEMMGIRDNYKSGTTAADDYEDGDSVVCVHHHSGDGTRQNSIASGVGGEEYESFDENEDNSSPPKRQKISMKRKATTRRKKGKGTSNHRKNNKVPTYVAKEEEERNENGGGTPGQAINDAFGGFISRIGATSHLKKSLEDNFIIPKHIKTNAVTKNRVSASYHGGRAVIDDDDDNDEDDYMMSTKGDGGSEATDDEFDHDL